MVCVNTSIPTPGHQLSRQLLCQFTKNRFTQQPLRFGQSRPVAQALALFAPLIILPCYF